MQIHISPNDGVPIYLQIVNQVKYLVVVGPAGARGGAAADPGAGRAADRQSEHGGPRLSRARGGGRGGEAEDGGDVRLGRGLAAGARERLRILTERVDALLAEARQMDIGVDEVVDLVRRGMRR